VAVEGPASFVEVVELPEMPVEEIDQMVATIAAETTATDYSKKKRPTMTPATDFAVASDYVAIDPFVVLFRGESWKSLYSDSAVAANYSTCC